MIDGETRLYGIIGNPVRHTLSPVIHNRAFKRMGLNAVYLAFEVCRLESTVEGIRGLGIQGVSVTIPFKMDVIPYLDEIDTMAARIKAVNTVTNKGGRLIGHNTDWKGALAALEAKVDLSGKRVYLFGAGGAARAVAFGLKESGARITVFNRSAERARELANELGCLHQPLSSIGEASGLDADLLINATSAGMHPNDGESPVPKRILKKGMAVMDLVYSPLRTRLLREAEQQGCQTIDGLEMLAHQGAAQLEIWTGKRPDVREIKEDLRKALGRNGD